MDDTGNVLLAGMFPIVLSIADFNAWVILFAGIVAGVYSLVKLYYLIKNKGK